MKKSNNKNSGSDLFELEIAREYLQNERFRNLLLATIFGALFLISLLVSVVYSDEMETIFGGGAGFLWVSVILLLLVIRAFIIRLIFTDRLKKGLSFPVALRYINAGLEASIPSLVIIIIAQYVDPMKALVTPVVYIYFIFILLTTLELDFKISLVSGFVAASEFLGLALYYLAHSKSVETASVLNIAAPYYGKSAIMLAMGLVSGLIARQIKTRISEKYKILLERNRIEKLFGQQISPDIVEELIHSKKGIESRRRYVCIMFLDIRGFTPFSEGKSPEDIIKYQNDLFSYMIEIINKRHGIINQILGDGFMATFGAPVSRGNDCRNAVEAAQDILKHLHVLNESGKIPETRIGIGLHAGEVVTGNVGTEVRQQYSVTGNVVILASRVEQLNKQYNSSLLISKEVLDRADLVDLEREALGEVPVKGRQKPIEIFKLE